MRTYRLERPVVVLPVGVWVISLLVLGVAPAAQGEVTSEAGVQILTRGPVHEAFAEASMAEATAGVIITMAPSDPIVELPPDQRPEGANVAWIPGYWSWDDDRTDFIWVSGVWRDLPPGRQWVPGYWTPVQGGSQWISGFWGDVAQTEVTYLPPPPEPLEAGPNSPTPGPDNMWTPGCWVWQQTRYAWQPGYWVVQQPDWVWAPAHYTWTPRGYVYVPGYWDHDIVHRGVMFAPVYYEQPVYRRPSYSYSPIVVIDLGVILAGLFVQPRSHHYYYGDYYDRRYQDRGFHPWYTNEVTRYGADPIYAHYRSTQLHQDPDWDVHIEEQYKHRRDHVDARPPQTFALQVNINNTQKAGVPENLFIGKRLADVIQSKRSPLRFTPVNMDERKQMESRGREVHRFQFERAKMEAAPKAAKKSKADHQTAQPFKMEFRVSPVAARATKNVGDTKSPPPPPIAPEPQAENRNREGKPQRVEAQTETPRAQEKPEKAKPRRVEAQTETPRPQEKPEKVKPHRDEAQTETPRAQEKPEKVKPDVQAHPERTETRQSPTNEKPERVQAKPEAPNPEVSSRNTQPKSERHRAQGKNEKSKREQPPRTEDNKNEKGDKR